MQRRLARSFLPTTAVLELTYNCSHSCLYCSCPWERENGCFERRGEMPTERWKSSIELLVENGVSSLALTGGEALLRQDLMEIIEHAASLRCRRLDSSADQLVETVAPPALYLLTNGRVVSRRLLEDLAEIGVKLSISLPGLDTYSRHTGFRGAEMVLNRLSMARDAGVTTTANITVTALNLPELGRTMAAALAAGAQQVLLNRFLPGGRGMAHRELLELDVRGVRQMLEVADEVLERTGRFGALGTELPLCVADPEDYPHIRVSTRCSAARKFFVVGPSGYVRVCNHSEQRLLPVERWFELQENPYWRTFATSDFFPGECDSCGYRGLCDAGCREAACVTAGRPDAPDPLLDRESPGSGAGTY